jgi:hypothetical protein
LDRDPVAKEKFATDKDSPLMWQTVSKAIATAFAAAASVRQLQPIKPALIALRGITPGAYRIVSWIRRT